MRIKKKHIQEDIDKARKLAKNDVDDITTIAGEIESSVEPITGNIEDAKFLASKIATTAIDTAYNSEVNETDFPDDVVSRGIEAGINPELSDLSNDWNGQDGGPDYGDKKPRPTINTTSVGGADTNDNMLECDDNLHSRIQALKAQIDRTKDPEKLASLKDWLGKMEKEELAASKGSKTNENVRPKMSKDQLIETILGNKKRKVIKTFKVKNLRK